MLGNKNTPEHWKARYLDSLEQAENSEKMWLRTESLLRNAIIRLCLAAEGVDNELDKRLDSIRSQMRKPQKDEQITQVISDINLVLARLEKEKKEKSKSLTPAIVLDAILTAVEFPKGCGRYEKAVRKVLAKGGDDYVEAIRTFSELLKKAFELAAEQDESTASEKEERKGLLGKMFGKQAKETVAESAVTVPDQAAEKFAAVVLHEVLRKIDFRKDGFGGFANMSGRIDVASGRKELMKLAAGIGEIVAGLPLDAGGREEKAPAQEEAVQEQPVPADDHDGADAREVLLLLLERLELPESETERIEALQVRLESAVSENEWPDILAKIADIIRQVRISAQAEKQALEAFLVQITGSLGEIDENIRGMEQNRVDAHADSIRLGEAVDDEVRNLNTRMAGSNSVDEIKRLIQDRLQHISGHIEQFRELEDKRNTEAEQRISELTEKLQTLDSESEELRNTMQKAREEAMRDRLTGLYNRMAYDERLADEFARWKRYLEPLSMVVIDIDHFKKINDSFGHLAGDKALSTLAKLIMNRIRETDFVARYGGEEFVMLMPGTRSDEALLAAEKLREAVENSEFHYRGQRVTITISIGISEFLSSDTPTDVFARADKALYNCKRDGRNQCQLLNN